MSTIYFENDKDYKTVIANHYDVDEIALWEAIFYEFEETDIPKVQDVFCATLNAYIVTKDNDNDLTIFEMARESFMENWSEAIWTKFRMDSYTTVCPECGEKMASSVSGTTLSDIGRIEQFHCNNCHYTWIGYPSGKFIREGVLYSSWDVR